MDLIPFHTKYPNLHKKWGLKKKFVSNTIDASNIIAYSKDSVDKARKLPAYYRDRRTPERYVYDLAEGWLIETLVAEWLKWQLDAKVKVSGRDKDRVIQDDPGNITSDQDITITYPDGNSVKLEILTSRKVLKEYHPKRPKVERAISDGSMFLYVIVGSGTYFIVNPADLRNQTPAPWYPFGGKDVYFVTASNYEHLDIGARMPDKYCKMLGYTKTVLRKVPKTKVDNELHIN